MDIHQLEEEIKNKANELKVLKEKLTALASNQTLTLPETRSKGPQSPANNEVVVTVDKSDVRTKCAFGIESDINMCRQQSNLAGANNWSFQRNSREKQNGYFMRAEQQSDVQMNENGLMSAIGSPDSNASGVSMNSNVTLLSPVIGSASGQVLYPDNAIDLETLGYEFPLETEQQANLNQVLSAPVSVIEQNGYFMRAAKLLDCSNLETVTYNDSDTSGLVIQSNLAGGWSFQLNSMEKQNGYFMIAEQQSDVQLNEEGSMSTIVSPDLDTGGVSNNSNATLPSTAIGLSSGQLLYVDDVIDMETLDVGFEFPLETEEEFLSSIEPLISEFEQEEEVIGQEPEPSTEITVVNKSQQSACNKDHMVVQTSDQPKTHKRLCCLYCKKTYIALGRHLATVHKNEPDVQKFVHLPDSLERKSIIAVLRNRGTQIWNSDPALNKGRFITCRRPNVKFNRTALDFNTCGNCLGTYSITGLRGHVRRCVKHPIKGQRIVQILGRAIEGRLHARASERLRTVVFPVLREDKITRLIRYDWLVIEYGNKLCMKYVPHYQHNMIRARIRLAGRLLHTIKEINPSITDFASIYDPVHYDSLIEAIRISGGYNSASNEFKSPATASMMVTHVKQISVFLIAECIKRKEPENQLNVENFLKLMQSDISLTINKIVTETQAKRRREKIEKLPTTDDIKTFSLFLNREREKSFEKLNTRYSFENWENLSELCVASLIAFNRRRVGEIQNIELKAFEKRESINEKTNPELFAKLSEESKKIALKYQRLKIRGKKVREVAVLLNPHVVQCIQLLIKHRNDARISENNPFLFALPTCLENQIKVVDACSVLRKFSEISGASDPKSLRGTKMRKHMATMCISFELNDNSVAQIADFMGHHEKIHREYYRRNPIEEEIVKISQLLLKAQGRDEDSDCESEDGNGEQRFDNTDAHSADENSVGYDSEVEREVLAVDADSNVECDIEPKLLNEMHPEYRPTAPPKNSKKSQKRRRDTSTDDSDDENVSKVKYTKKRWSKEELAAVRKAFSIHFRNQSLPSTEEIRGQQMTYPELRTRTWQQVKTWISNQHQKAKRTAK